MAARLDQADRRTMTALIVLGFSTVIGKKQSVQISEALGASTNNICFTIPILSQHRAVCATYLSSLAGGQWPLFAIGMKGMDKTFGD